MTTTTMVNGFPCKDCTDIDYAKKHIDPAHPKDGPYGIDKPDSRKKPGIEDLQRQDGVAGTDHGPAVQFSGVLSDAAVAPSVASTAYTPGSTLNLSA